MAALTMGESKIIREKLSFLLIFQFPLNGIDLVNVNPFLPFIEKKTNLILEGDIFIIQAQRSLILFTHTRKHENVN